MLKVCCEIHEVFRNLQCLCRSPASTVSMSEVCCSLHPIRPDLAIVVVWST